jgi:cellulose synthase/poly-beta-1,6-N-acetylglucosamine synthase-like glycosyltransferase
VISVIIPAHNAAATLGDCLRALAAEGVPGPEAELIVVDDASTDGTRALAEAAGARLIAGGGRGPAAARNLGARIATGELLLYLDADTAPERGWRRAMLAPFADPAVVAVKGRYHTRQRSAVARFSQLEFEEKYRRLERARRVDFVDTGTAAYRRAAFLAAGGFDEQFPPQSAEDVELAFRLAASGARLAFSPRAAVLHRHAERLRDYLMKKLRYGYYRVGVYRHFPNKALGDSYTPPLMAAQIALAGLTGLFAILALLRAPGAGRGLAATLTAFAATTLPLARRAAATDRPLAPLVPPLVFARSFAQGLGIFIGLAALLSRRIRARA